MEKRTSNINIESKYGMMCYMIDHHNTNKMVNSNDININKSDLKTIHMYIDKEKLDDYDLTFIKAEQLPSLEKHDMFFYINNAKNNEELHKFLPGMINISDIYLKFPQFSVDTYEKGILYAISLNLWINDINIYLGSYLINRNDSLALRPIERHMDNNYYEYVKLPIINPYSIIYDKEWSKFRKAVGKTNYNNIGSILSVSLYPVYESYDHTNNKKIYLSKEDYTGSVTSLNIYKETVENYFNIGLSFHEDDIPEFRCDLNYNNNYESLSKYYEDTYRINLDDELLFELVFKDKDNIIKIVKANIPEQINNVIYFRKESPLQKNDNNIVQFSFENIEGWHEGIFALAFLTLTGKDDRGHLCENIISSNIIHFPLEQLKYFIYDTRKAANQLEGLLKINLDDMNVININAVNKIINNVILVDKPEDSKSGIICPVFYSVKDASNVILHRNIIENICINLNAYKSSVKIFKITIGGSQQNKDGITFAEKGRTANGVIFQIIGGALPENIKEGIYLIKDEHDNPVTTGNYIILNNAE